MTLKEVAARVVELDPEHLTCRGSLKDTQLKLSSTEYPGEVKHLLSPYYQHRIHQDAFGERDLEGVLEEAKSFMKYGV